MLDDNHERKFSGVMLKALRTAQGITIEELRRVAECRAIQTVRNWEDGNSEPSLTQADKLAKFLGVEVRVLLTITKVA